MVERRRGRTNFGCLFSILLLVTAVYFGVNVGEPYFRYYRFLDGMKQEARFSSQFTDEQIQTRLAALADSLGLPEAAGKVSVRRESNRISLSRSYSERVEMPLIVRDIPFSPHVEWAR